MFDFDKLVNAVQQNCHISDARYAGNYTLCTYLLKMREYYRWEHDIPLSNPLPREAIGAWLVEREQAWEQLECVDFSRIPFDHADHDPFDSDAINSTLVQHGYVYSSGYGVFNKPLFFLGKLYRHENIGDISLYVSACEYARDLSAPPAMLQGNTIYIRFESLRRSIWERIEEWRWRPVPEHPLYHAVRAYGIDLLDNKSEQAELEELLDVISDREINTIVQHELGESQAGKSLGPHWQEMVFTLGGSKAEFIARAARDHLADCLCTLPYLLEQNNPAQVHYYFSNFSSIRRGIWPALYDAYSDWRSTGNSAKLKRTIFEGQLEWLSACNRMLDAYHDKDVNTGKMIEQLYAGQLK